MHQLPFFPWLECPGGWDETIALPHAGAILAPAGAAGSKARARMIWGPPPVCRTPGMAPNSRSRVDALVRASGCRPWPWYGPGWTMPLVDAPRPRWRRWLFGPPVDQRPAGLFAICFAAVAASAGLRLGTPGDLTWLSWTVLALYAPLAAG